MLFDLRSRGRRRTVQVIYAILALLMLCGLVLFGVGAGNSGGLLNAFTNSGSSSGQTAAVDSQTRAALKAVKATPDSASAWGNLILARYTAASEGNNFNSTTGAYTASGKKQLQAAIPAWNRYLQLMDNKPGIDYATLMGQAFAVLGQYPQEASAWEFVADAAPTQPKGFLCLAFSAYAAKQTRKAELAAATAVTLVPKLQQLTIKSELSQAKSSPDSYAQSC